MLFQYDLSNSVDLLYVQSLECLPLFVIEIYNIVSWAGALGRDAKYKI